MKPKEEFLRALQQLTPGHTTQDLAFVVRCALNLKQHQVPRDIRRGARRFFRRLSH